MPCTKDKYFGIIAFLLSVLEKYFFGIVACAKEYNSSCGLTCALARDVLLAPVLTVEQ